MLNFKKERIILSSIEQGKNMEGGVVEKERKEQDIKNLTRKTYTNFEICD